MKQPFFPCGTDPYTLPTISFVGGTTEILVFYTYFHGAGHPFDLSKCSANFAMVNYINKTGAPIVSKSMTISSGDTDTGGNKIVNKLSVTLDSSETVNLYGKYVYQISIKQNDGVTEIPNQGIIYINNNINKPYISQ